MRIVHVASFYGPPSESVSEALAQLGDGYRRAGHEFYLIGPGTSTARTTTAAGTRITVPAVRSVDGRRSLVPLGFAIRDLLTELAPDRVELSDRLTRRVVTEWADKNGIPTVVFDTEGAHGPAAAERMSEGVPGDLPLLGRRKADITPGVDLAEFSPLRWSRAARLRHSEGAEVLLVHLGGLTRRGAPSLSLDALVELRRRGVDARLVLPGADGLSPRLARLARALPVTLTGEIRDSRQRAILLANADVAISPGPGRNSIAGLEVLQALAAGTPVVATTRSDAASVLAHGADEVTRANGGALADAVQRVLDQRVDERRSDARARAAQYPWQATVKSLLDLHEFPGLLEPEFIPAR